MFCGRRAPASKSVLQPNSIYTFGNYWLFWINRVDILVIGYSLETVAGFDWESMSLATFCALLVPHSSKTAHLFGNLSSVNWMTWVSEFSSEISIRLWKKTVKRFCLRNSLVIFGKYWFVLVGVKSYKIPPPLLWVISLKLQPGNLFCSVATPSNGFLCLCLEQSGTLNAYPGGRSQALEMAQFWSCRVGMSISLSRNGLVGTK